MPSRYAIIGTRHFTRLDLVKELVDHLPKWAVIVSGGAIGPDSTAVSTAESLGMTTEVYPPRWHDENGVYRPGAAFERNGLVVKNADAVFAFWDGKSGGTLDAIQKAVKLGKTVTIFNEKSSVQDVWISGWKSR